MSQPSKSISEQVEEFDLSVDTLREVYHVPVLAALFAFTLWVRISGWRNYTERGQILFSGNDPWYHYRMVQYTVNHWPSTMPFDPWTGFPVGKNPSTFGTLFDQLIATAALVYGLGSPTPNDVKLVTLFAPAVMGALAIIPIYFIGKRLGGRGGGLIGALIAVMSPGLFLTRGLVGVADHQIAEVLFMAIAVVLLLKAFAVARRDRPIWELFTARDFDALRPTLLWSVLAGVGIGLYIWVWPAGVVLVGILNVFLVLYLLATFARGGTPDHLGITGAVTLTVTLLMSLIQLETLNFSVEFSLTQPLVAASGVVACVVIVGGSRLWDSMDADRPRWQFGAGLFVLGVVAAALVAVLLPDIFNYFSNQVLRVVGFTATATASTVGEATPPEDPIGLFYDSYGFAFFTAMIGLVFLLYRSLREEHIDPTGFFVVVWSLFLLAMANTMTRFAIYMVLPVAVLNAFLAKEAFDLLGLPDLDRDLSDIRGYQVLSIAAVILIVTAPLAVQAGQGGLSNAAMDTAESRNSATPGAARWVEGLEWLEDETPEAGQWGQDPETGLGQGYYGTYARTDDFDYGSGDYGVLAWWDYGHWITVIGERIPIANPFQQNANYAADLLLSTNESYATEEMSDTMGDGSQTRYVMLDYQMGLAGTVKFGAPAAFERRYYVDEETGEYYSGEPPAGVDASGLNSTDLQRTIFVVQQQNQQVRALSRYAVHTQRSMESLRTRLYQFHGSRAEPTYPEGGVVVADWETTETGARIVPQETQPFRRFDNMSAAESYVRTDGSSQIGGVFGKPSEPVPALEHYRLVWASPRPSQTPASRAFGIWNQLNGQPSRPIATEPWLKTFERVEGATVEGQGPANTTITAQVQMRMPTNGRTFTYEQEARTGPNGEFTMTVPYSTTGYDEFGPEQARTNVSVRAAGPYRFYGPTTDRGNTTTRPYATANVTEAQVIGVDGAPTEVTLEETAVADPSSTGDGSSPDDGSTGNGADGTDGGATPTPTPAATPAATPTATPDTSDGAATPAATPTATPDASDGSASLVPPAPAWLPPAPVAGLLG